MRLQELLYRLQNVRQTGSGYQASCPAHQDDKPSLSVAQGNGRLLLKCHAGCSFESVRDALGLTNEDLRSDGRPKALRATVLATYDYRDEGGTLLYQVVRFQPKGFRQRRPDGHGDWVWNMTGVRRVVYHLPELLASGPDRTVYIVEGEKAADRLASEGLLAICSPGGAGKWRRDYAEHLRGRDVVVLPDNDSPGRDHAEQVSRSLANVAASVRVLALPGLPAKADAYDWLEAGHTGSDLERLASGVQEVAADTVAESEAEETPLGTVEAFQKDYGHADRLSTHFRGRFRWATHLGAWMEWQGQVWRPTPEERVAKVAADLLRSEYAGRLATAERSEIGDLATALREACTYTRIMGALNFLKGWDGILTRPEQWDREPWTLNVDNGLLDLHTGQLRPHSPDDLCTKLAPIAHNPAAEGEVWQAHLDRFLPDPEVRRQVQRDLGLSLVGATLEESLGIWYGTGANGKTTTARALQEVLADYAKRAAPNLLVSSRNERHPTEVADLCGSRLVFSVEVDEGKRLAEALVKELTGGDRKKARLMRQDFFEFEQTFSIVLIVNHKPVISGTDEGIWRRVRLVPWQHRIPKGERRPQDEVLADLVEDGSGILNWLMAGLADWQADSHWVAPAVQAATDAYRSEQDLLGEFLGEVCERGTRFKVSVGELHEAYVAWCAQAGEEPLGKRRFSDLLRQRGIQGGKADKGVRVHRGIRLRQPDAGQVAQGGSDSGSLYKSCPSLVEPEHAPPNATCSRQASQTEDEEDYPVLVEERSL